MSTVQLKLSTKVENSNTHTVSIENGTGVNSSVVNTGNVTTTSFTSTPTVSTQATIATVTFTASIGYYYSKEPSFGIKTSHLRVFNISSTVTKDSKNRITAKVFVIKYTNSVAAIGQVIRFSYDTELYLITPEQIAAFIASRNLLEINSVIIDTSDASSAGASRTLEVRGDLGCKFNVKITKDNPSGSNTTYDFNTDTFTAAATELVNAAIDISGVYSTNINIPPSTVDDTYTIEVVPNFGLGTTLDSRLSVLQNNQFLVTKTISQFKLVTITLSLVSDANANKYGTLPSNVTITGERYSSRTSPVQVTWPVNLTSNAFYILDQPDQLDFRSTITKTIDGAITGNSTRTIVLDDTTGIFPGLSVSHASIQNYVRIKSVDQATKTITVSDNLNIDGTLGDGATLSFQYGGTVTTENFTGHSFRVGYRAEDGTNPKFKVVLADVSTKTNGTVSNSRVVNVDSQAGILARSTVFVAGRGINGTTVAPHVDAITHESTNNRLQLSVAQTIEDNVDLTFTGSSMSATITFDYYVDNFGSTDITLVLALDAIIPVQ
jgi:hypothetical protein